MKTRVIISLFAVSASLFINGCTLGYDCPAMCDPHARVLAQEGYNETDGSGGGMDEATVCSHEAVVAATNCEECNAAIENTYRISIPTLQCDCPPSEARADGVNEIYVYDDNCELVVAPYDVEGCQAFVRGNQSCQ